MYKIYIFIPIFYKNKKDKTNNVIIHSDIYDINMIRYYVLCNY